MRMNGLGGIELDLIKKYNLYLPLEVKVASVFSLLDFMDAI